MIVLHTAIVDRRLCVWGEAAPGSGAAAEPDQGLDPSTLPFAATADQLAEALARADGGFRPNPGRMERITAQLPTRGRRPVPSSPMVAEPPRGRGRLRIRPWQVTGVALDLEEALTLLLSARGRKVLAPGLPISADLAFWSEALELVLRIVAKGEVLASLMEADGAFEARWEPIFAPPVLEALAHLARRMPPAARALGSSAESEPLELVRAFVEVMTDHLVRSAQWPEGILPPRTNGEGPPASSSDRTPDEAWLEALRAPDPRVHGDPEKIAGLAGRIRDWRRPLHGRISGPWRLTFRLDEPDASTEPDGPGTGGDADEMIPSSGETWCLEYVLQDASEPSLALPLSEAWSPSTAEARAFLRGRSPRAFLLQSLGQAARLCAGVDRSFENPSPARARLDTGEAHRFLRDEAPLLQAAGFGVQLPAWWTDRRTPPRPTLRAIATPDAFDVGGGSLDLGALISVRWEVLVGDRTLSDEELEALARLEAPLVRLEGRWMELDTGVLDEVAARARGEGLELPANRLLRMALGAEEGPGKLQVREVEARGAFGELLEGLREAHFRLLDPPQGLDAELRPYQRRGLSWLAFLGRWGLGACLADDMGLGKTIQTLALVQRDREEGATTARPVLVVCPTSVSTNWLREAERFVPELEARLHHGPDRLRGPEFTEAAGTADLIVTTYALLHRDIEDLAKVPWRAVVLDEAQNIKNPDTRRARAARSLPADFRVALTGTPVENHVGDLWSIMEFLNPGLLGGRGEFRKRYFLPIQSRGDEEAGRRLRRITRPFVLRRVKTDRTVIRDLPDRIDTHEYCTLTREQATLYRAIVRELEESLAGGAEGIQRKGIVLATLTRLKQVCNHPAQFLDDSSPIPGRSGKVERLVELLDEVRDVGGRSLIFTQYARMGTLLQAHLQEQFGREVPFLHGGVSRTRRQEMVDRFQEEEGPETFILSLKAGGTGLNLTAANHVFLFDRWWNPAVETQATDRAYRIGQRRNVHVHRFVCQGTVEEQIDQMVERKRGVARKVVGAGEAWLTELDDDELRSVFALRSVDAEGEDDPEPVTTSRSAS